MNFWFINLSYQKINELFKMNLWKHFQKKFSFQDFKRLNKNLKNFEIVCSESLLLIKQTRLKHETFFNVLLCLGRLVLPMSTFYIEWVTLMQACIRYFRLQTEFSKYRYNINKTEIIAINKLKLIYII